MKGGENQVELAAAINRMAEQGWITVMVPVALSADVWARVAMLANHIRIADDPIENLGGAISQIVDESSESGFVSENVFKWKEELDKKPAK